MGLEVLYDLLTHITETVSINMVCEPQRDSFDIDLHLRNSSKTLCYVVGGRTVNVCSNNMTKDKI